MLDRQVMLKPPQSKFPAARLVCLIVFALPLTALCRSNSELPFTITPAAAGEQIIRTSIPLPMDFVSSDQTLAVHDAARLIQATVRPVSWYPSKDGRVESVRRAIIIFPYRFKSLAPVQLKVSAARKEEIKFQFPVRWKFEDELLHIDYAQSPSLEARFMAPVRGSREKPTREIVESNAFYRWERFHFRDSEWPRMIEIRCDAMGEVVVVAHLQRHLPGNGRAPDIGWELTGSGPALLRENSAKSSVSSSTAASLTTTHTYTNGTSCTLLFAGDKYCVYHPAAPLKRRGFSQIQQGQGKFDYRYKRCTADEKVPMQSMAWQRAELVISPANLAPLKATLQSPHQARFDSRTLDSLYAIGEPLELNAEPKLQLALAYHHNAIIHGMSVGDDWGNILSYTDGRADGGVFGMNRLNHCPAIFQEGWRSGDDRLIDTALLWCDNFYDQSIWWGEKEYGGTRYNNMIAQGRTPPDDDHTYMWRSNDSVNFCTKGYDAFWLAYEETGDPRMLKALEAQVHYATEHVRANTGECRNVGDVREFIRLYSYTGEKRYFDEAVRLFRELRTKLSPAGLFDQGGKPLTPHLPFIDDDEAGTKVGYAKPYIIGYALAGLPELASLVPSEPRLREVIEAVADFLTQSQDPLGGWRYPHPRSSYLILNQGMEHAWQIVQADRFLGMREKHLDAIERVLRQRILTWLQTGKTLSGLSGWEMSTGKIKDRSEIYKLYQSPEERDFTRDYHEGSIGIGSCSPEGLVYFPEVLSFYLKYRPVARLLSPATLEEPLGQVLARTK